MGRNNFDDEDRNHKKHKPKHSRNVRGQGMRVINSYDEEYDEYDDPFEDEFEVQDEIFITHTKNTR